MLCIIVFIKKSKSVFSWYFLSKYFKAVKELHKLRFLISINRTTPNLLFFGHQVRKAHVNVYKLSDLNYTHKSFLQKTFNLSSHF